MAQVEKGTIGWGILNPGQSHIWTWYVSGGDVWHFWAHNNSLAYGQNRVRVEWVNCMQQDGGYRIAEIHVRNVHAWPQPATWVGYVLHYARIF